MQRLLEYIAHHPYLFAGVVVASIAVIVNELRERMNAFAAVSCAQAVQMMNQGALVLDVRGKELFDAGHINEARNIGTPDLGASSASLKKWREKTVITYCDSGLAGAGAARELTKLGFSKVFNLAGGLNAWRKENLPVAKSGPAQRNSK